MTSIEKYYDLLDKANISNYKISLYELSPEEKRELTEEAKYNSNIKQQLEILKIELSKKTEDVDYIRTAFIHVANGVLNSFEKIEKWGNHYPDLDQGMIIRGYLLGKILSDFKTALKFEGALPSVEIYMSTYKWDYEPLKHLIENLKDELIKSYFETKMQAIEYYEHIRKSVLQITERLRKERII